MADGYQVQFGNSGSQASTAAMSSPSTFYVDGNEYGGGAVFGAEDQGGTDYNDTSLSIQWYESVG